MESNDPLFFFNLIVTLCLYVKATSVAYIKMNVKPTQSLDFLFSGLKEELLQSIISKRTVKFELLSLRLENKVEF